MWSRWQAREIRRLSSLAVVAVVLTGCQTAGRPTAGAVARTTDGSSTATTPASPSVTPTQPIPASGPDLSSVSPCELLTAAQLDKLGVIPTGPPQEARYGGEVGCAWAVPAGVLGVTVLPVTDLSTQRWRWDFLIGGLRARRHSSPDMCTFTLAVSMTSTVAVAAVQNAEGTATAAQVCDYASRAAELVATNLS